MYKLHYKQIIGTLSIIISLNQPFFQSSADIFAVIPVDVVENSVDTVEIWWYYIVWIGVRTCGTPFPTHIINDSWRGIATI